MKTLPSPALPNAILSFDFDGTLHDPTASPSVPAPFFDLIRDLRTNHHALWGINTGRSLEYLIEGMQESAFPFLPDFVVTREREIHQADSHGHWQPHNSWNHRCDHEIQTLFKRTRHLLDQIRHDIAHHTGAQWIDMPGEPAGIISRTELEMEWIVSHIKPLVIDEPHLTWQRNSIYLRFGHRDFQKGSSLGEVARLHRLPAARCFAMGDSHNDLEMLDPSHARMIACPANALPEVITHVTDHGGMVAPAKYGQGVIEALQFYFPS